MLRGSSMKPAAGRDDELDHGVRQACGKAQLDLAEGLGLASEVLGVIVPVALFDQLIGVDDLIAELIGGKENDRWSLAGAHEAGEHDVAVVTSSSLIRQVSVDADGT